MKLAESIRIEGIQPTEFGIAEWDLSTESLPRRFTVWFEAICDEPVSAASKRLLAKRTVRLK